MEKLLRRVRTDRRYRVSHFGLPNILAGDALQALAYATLVERNCTYVDSLREVGPEYEIPVEYYWETHTDPQTGRTLVDGHETTFGTSPSSSEPKMRRSTSRGPTKFSSSPGFR